MDNEILDIAQLTRLWRHQVGLVFRQMTEGDLMDRGAVTGVTIERRELLLRLKEYSYRLGWSLPLGSLISQL